MINVVLFTILLSLGGGSGSTTPADPYAHVLATHVNAEGLVDYAALKADRAPLDACVASLAAASTAAYESMSEKERVAFWINAYNALTLKTIVDHYPIQPARPTTGIPKNSIRQIPGVWDQNKFTVMGKPRTLDEIEHKVLRADFKEPRIHVALVCAALSCPKLRREPYAGARLDAQLDDQARAFFKDLRHLHIDREAGEVWTSRILDWFADDFAPEVAGKAESHDVKRRALVNFAGRYVSDADRAYLEAGKYAVQYFDYDWTLNEQVK